MKNRIIALFIICIPLVTACSTTSGDGAYRSDHPEQAALLYKQGADQGDSLAALKLGLMISDVKVSTTKYGSPVKWYKRACELGNNPGCHNTGNAYEYGQYGVSKDYEKALEYYTHAADRGYMQSQYNIGTLYSNQHIKNDIEGLKWLFIAMQTAANCSALPLCQWVQDDPPGHIKKLTERMNKNQITKAKSLAIKWKAKK